MLKLDVIVFPLSIRNSEAAIMHLLQKSNASHLFYSNEYLPLAMKINEEFGEKLKLYAFQDICIATLTQLEESTFKPIADVDELERIRIIFHRYESTL